MKKTLLFMTFCIFSIILASCTAGETDISPIETEVSTTIGESTTPSVTSSNQGTTVTTTSATTATVITPPPFDIKEDIIDSAKPEKVDFFSGVKINSEFVDDYKDVNFIDFVDGADYASDLGVITFRGNNYRDGGSFGTADITEEELEIEWSFDIGIIVTQSGGYWPGTGWTGQPAIVHWDKEVLQIMNIYDKFKEKDLVEVIYATLDGNIYFCDLDTGEFTRPPINIGYPTKGSVSIDPRGYPILYTGQGIGENGVDSMYPHFRIFNLIDQSLLFSIDGNDSDAYRAWYNWDPSGLLDIENDTFYQWGENGILYKIKMNTDFDIENATLAIDPEMVEYVYLNPYTDNMDDMGVENSPVIYKHYLYSVDNGGLLMCIDLNTLETIWIANVEDDTDATLVLEDTDDGVFIYTANEVDNRGVTPLEKIDSSIKKFNALTGELVWTKNYPATFDNIINGGALASPIIGKNDMDGLVIFNIAKAYYQNGGKLVALDKFTGEEVWVIDFHYYSWSSPVAVYSDDGKGYIVFCTYWGEMHLIDGATGTILNTVSVEANVESTPAIYNNTIVVGSYAQKIFGVNIK